LDAFTQVVEQLAADGLITTKPVRLTDKGRGQALGFLGITDLPPRTNWRSLRDRYLLFKALNLPINNPSVGKRLGKAGNLVALLMKQQHQLPAGSGETLPRAMEALACKELGFPEEATLEGVMLRVLSRFIGADEKLPGEQLKKQLPRVVAGTADGQLDTLRQAVIRRWASGTPGTGSAERFGTDATHPGEAGAEDFDLPTFAATVVALARSCPTGRFGDNKVFIASVYRLSQAEASFPRMTLPEFKSRLIEANRQGLLQLSRADLVQAMDPVLVAESEARLEDDVTFHFILLEEVRP
jgi:hypothetical protein